jgi:tetratricopeptide (TPR) repeat protein
MGQLDLETLDGLASLVDKSLLTVREMPGNERRPRIGMLETVKEFARDQLLASSEAEAVQREHARYFVALAGEARPELSGPDQSEWLDRLEQEHDNLRAVLRMAQQTEDIGLGVDLAGTLWPFWWARNHFEEAQRWLDAFLPRSEAAGVSPPVRAHALHAAGALVGVQGDNGRSVSLLRQALVLARQTAEDECTAATLQLLGETERGRGHYQLAEELLEESLTVYRRLDDQPGVCAVLSAWAGVARYQGDYARAVTLYREALALSRTIGDVRRVADTLARLGSLASEQGRPSASVPPYEEALTLHRQLGDTFGIADILLRSGESATDLGDYAGAMELLDESLKLSSSLGTDYAVAYVLLHQAEAAIGLGNLEEAKALAGRSLALFQHIDDSRCTAFALMKLADVAREQLDYRQALALYKESLTLHWKLNTRPGMAQCLERMALLACAQGLGERAARLHGAAAALRDAMGSVMAPADRVRYDQSMAVVRGQMEDEAFAAQEAEGRAMSLEQAVTCALEAWSE